MAPPSLLVLNHVILDILPGNLFDSLDAGEWLGEHIEDYEKDDELRQYSESWDRQKTELEGERERGSIM